MAHKTKAKHDEEEKVSLYPFTPEEVMAGLLAVNPDDMPDDEEEEEPEQPESE